MCTVKEETRNIEIKNHCKKRKKRNCAHSKQLYFRAKGYTYNDSGEDRFAHQCCVPEALHQQVCIPPPKEIPFQSVPQSPPWKLLSPTILHKRGPTLRTRNRGFFTLQGVSHNCTCAALTWGFTDHLCSNFSTNGCPQIWLLNGTLKSSQQNMYCMYEHDMKNG